MKKKVSKLKIMAVIVVVLVCAALTAALIPIFASYNDSERLVIYIESFGVWGAFVLLSFQVFQIIVALIPGELIEFVAGVLYKTVLGTAICVFGVAVGEFLVFKFVKWLLKRHPDHLKAPKKFEKLKFLNDKKKLEYIIFLLFFVPGTPKDVLTYFVSFTKIELKKFLVLSCLARIPSIISSAYAGATFAEGDLMQTIIIYALIGIVSLVGIFIHNRFMNKGEKYGGK